MFKFLQDVIIKLLKGVVEQLRRIKKTMRKGMRPRTYLLMSK